MSLDDWILSLHVLSGFAMVAAMTLFWVTIVVGRDVDTVERTLTFGRVTMVGERIVIAGVAGTVVFGVWLAISVDRYALWDGWIIAALVLWAVAAGTGARAGQEYAKAAERALELRAAGEEGRHGELRALNRSPQGLRMHVLSSVALVLLVLDMIWKPGA